jgi:hypothetical protein
MRRHLLVLSVLAMLASPPALPASEFDWITREFARQSGAQALHIPLFGLARFVVAVAHPAGASDLKLAIFEKATVSSATFSSLIDSTVGTAWKPIVRVRERCGESSNIYVQPDGKHLRLLIATLTGNEVVFLQLRIHPEELIKFVDQQRHDHHA